MYTCTHMHTQKHETHMHMHTHTEQGWREGGTEGGRKMEREGEGGREYCTAIRGTIKEKEAMAGKRQMYTRIPNTHMECSFLYLKTSCGVVCLNIEVTIFSSICFFFRCYFCYIGQQLHLPLSSVR